MPTFDYNETRNTILQAAHRIVGALADNESLTEEMVSNGSMALNAYVKELQNDHVHLWLLTETSFVATAGIEKYSIASQNLIGVDVVRWVNGTEEWPIQLISWRDYQAIARKNDTGDPIKVAYDGALNPSLYFWPVPDSNITIRYLAVKKLQDFDAAGDAPDFTQRWLNCLIYGVASRLADEYGLPLEERNYLIAREKDFRFKAIGGDREMETETLVRSLY